MLRTQQEPRIKWIQVTLSTAFLTTRINLPNKEALQSGKEEIPGIDQMPVARRSEHVLARPFRTVSKDSNPNGPKLSRIFDADGICASRGHAFEK